MKRVDFIGLYIVGVILFLLVGCKPTTQSRDSDFVSFDQKFVTFNELQQNEILKPMLNSIQRSFSNYEGNDKNPFIIYTDTILAISTANSESYTFRVNKTFHPDADFENFVIEKINNSPFIMSVFSYKKITRNNKSELLDISEAIVSSAEINSINFNQLVKKNMNFRGCYIAVKTQRNRQILDTIWCHKIKTPSRGYSGKYVFKGKIARSVLPPINSFKDY